MALLFFFRNDYEQLLFIRSPNCFSCLDTLNKAQ